MWQLLGTNKSPGFGGSPHIFLNYEAVTKADISIFQALKESIANSVGCGYCGIQNAHYINSTVCNAALTFGLLQVAKV